MSFPDLLKLYTIRSFALRTISMSEQQRCLLVVSSADDDLFLFLVGLEHSSKRRMLSAYTDDLDLAVRGGDEESSLVRFAFIRGIIVNRSKSMNMSWPKVSFHKTFSGRISPCATPKLRSWSFILRI